MLVGFLAFVGSLVVGFFNLRTQRNPHSRQLQTVELARKFVEFWDFVNKTFPNAIEHKALNAQVSRACALADTVPLSSEFESLSFTQKARWLLRIVVRVPLNLLKSSPIIAFGGLLVWHSRESSARFRETLATLNWHDPAVFAHILRSGTFWPAAIIATTTFLCLLTIWHIFQEDARSTRPQTNVEIRRYSRLVDGLGSRVPWNKSPPTTADVEVPATNSSEAVEPATTSSAYPNVSLRSKEANTVKSLFPDDSY